MIWWPEGSGEWTSEPTKSVPGGCVVALFGFFSLCYSAIAGYGLIKAFKSTKEGMDDIIKMLSLHFGVSFVIAIALFWLGFKLAVQVGSYDQWDPDEPNMKF